MKIAIIQKHGNPTEVTRLEFAPDPQPAPHQVRLRWLAAPINPADLNWIEGVYGNKHQRPQLPAIPGMEGIAQVEAIGNQIDAQAPKLQVGDFVIAKERLGSWATHGMATPDQLWVIPQEFYTQVQASPEQWAQLRVNPLTAWCFLHEILPANQALTPGDTILLNAANSAVGQCVLALAQEQGIQVAAFARSHESLRQIQAQFPNALAFLDSQAGFTQAQETLKNHNIPLACNAVGSESALRQLKLLSEGGTQVTYGGMAKQATRLPTGLLIFKQLKLQGFWVSQWQKTAPKERLDQALRQLAQLLAQQKLKLPIEAIHPLENLSKALEQATQEKRQGKILFKI